MHLSRIKIYPNFWEIYWWNNMKKEIAQFVEKKMFDLPTNQSGTSKVVRVVATSIHTWEEVGTYLHEFCVHKKKKKKKYYSVDFVFGLPRSPRNHDAIWVVVDRFVHFILIWMNYSNSINKLTKIYINEIVRLHGVPVPIVSDRYSRFTLRFWIACKKPWVLSWTLALVATLKQMDNLRGLSRL